jgi:hypothetical protein
MYKHYNVGDVLNNVFVLPVMKKKTLSDFQPKNKRWVHILRAGNSGS